MDKRYQVFLSSTYADLLDERRAVLQALMEMDCIPAGMELFPAADEQQWAFIRRVIDDCDYYLLIIGGRYGSLSEHGISYTEQEYDYAIAAGLPVIAFIHGEPDHLPVSKSDIDPQLRAQLHSFRARVTAGRLVKFWRDAKELPGLVALSLQKTIRTHPRIGWMRASTISSAELLSELNESRKRNDALVAEVASLKAQQPVQRQLNALASMESAVTVTGTYRSRRGRDEWTVATTWKALFAMLAPYLWTHPSDATVRCHLEASLFALSGKLSRGTEKPKMVGKQFQKIKVQLSAYELVTVAYSETTNGRVSLFWSLTARGQQELLELDTVRNDA